MKSTQKSKVSKKSVNTKSSNQKKTSKILSKKQAQPKKKDTASKGKYSASKKISNEERELEAQSLQSNKSQMSDINIISKNSEFPKVKTYEIISYENIPYLLSFEPVKDKIKLTVVEKDSFPLNKYENFYSLEDLIKIHKWFNIFYNIENLIIEFEQLTKNENFAIEKKNRDVLSLYIVFPVDLMEKIEIQLPLNDINNMDLFSQLISKISQIESKENNDFALFDEKIENLGHILQNIEEAKKAKEEEMLQNQLDQEKQEHVENEENQENKESEGNNLEEMKDALKLKIEQKIKSDNNQENQEQKNDNDNDNNELKENEVQNIQPLPYNSNHLPFIDSRILSEDLTLKDKEIKFLNQWITPPLMTLPQPPKYILTKLIFSSEDEDDKALLFHTKCDNIAPTLTLIETTEGFRYGGFTFQTWESPEQSIFKKDKYAFIFSLDTEKKYEVTDEEKSIQCSKFWGPYFGEGGAICVPDNFLSEKNAFYHWPSSYNISEKDELTFGQEHTINISRYEVFQILINGEYEEEDEEEQEPGQEQDPEQMQEPEAEIE